jgi:protease I
MANVAFILADLYEDSEFTEPWQRLQEAGHQTAVIGLRRGAKVNGKKGHSTVTDLAIGDVRADEFDALVIPGGYSPDKLRVDEGMVTFTRELAQSGKPVAAICHAGWMLAEADVARGRRLPRCATSAPTWSTQGRTGWTRRWSWTATSSPPAPRPIYPRSAPLCWSSSSSP